MLRRLLLYLSTAGWARGLMTRLWVARRVAARFVAGETLEEAVNVSRRLNGRGLWVSLDYLGESVNDERDTQAVVKMYTDLIGRIGKDGLKASVSVKLTHLGLDIREELCLLNLRQILTAAKPHGIQVTIDMESSAYTETTLRIYRTMRHEYDFENIGPVIQAYLYRSENDMRALADEGAHVRLCKGAYLEPAEVAFPAKSDVDASYVRIMQDYLKSAPPAYLCLATHDERIITQAVSDIETGKIEKRRYEFQMLYGIRESRQEELVKAGYPVRVYVPFGEAWYPYFMRRLAERPANLWFFAKSFFSR